MITAIARAVVTPPNHISRGLDFRIRTIRNCCASDLAVAPTASKPMSFGWIALRKYSWFRGESSGVTIAGCSCLTSSVVTA